MNVDVWRKCQAIGIFKVINNVFGDLNAVSQLEDDVELDREYALTDSEFLHESSFLSFGDSQDFEEMESECTIDSENSEHNFSRVFFFFGK